MQFKVTCFKTDVRSGKAYAEPQTIRVAIDEGFDDQGHPRIVEHTVFKVFPNKDEALKFCTQGKHDEHAHEVVPYDHKRKWWK